MNTLADGLKQVIAEVLNLDPDEITAEDTFIDDLGADSLDVFQIIMGVEGKFNIDIPTNEAEQITTVGEAMELISHLLAR
jgi:acyl carrier protein